MAPQKYGTFSDCRKNANGGYYLKGESYDFAKKMEVITNFFDFWKKSFPRRPTLYEVARASKTSHMTVKRFIEEFEKNGRIVNPKEKKWVRQYTNNEIDSVFGRLTLDEEAFLMSLHAEDPSRPNQSYVVELKRAFGTDISTRFVTRWFQHRYEHNGNFCKAVMIPLDKFKETNWFRYFEYRMMLDLISDHSKFNFLDEKHIWNHNGQKLRVRRNPITGQIPSVKVSGNFRDSQSIIACITTNKTKPQKLFFTIGKQNNDSDTFMLFVRLMVAHRFLRHGEVIVMDNCAIHHGGFAARLQEFVWHFEVDGEPLRVLILFLPARAPELNPIELVFGVLQQRISSFKYRQAGPLCENIMARVTAVLRDIGADHDLILRCCRHCGYNIGNDAMEGDNE